MSTDVSATVSSTVSVGADSVEPNEGAENDVVAGSGVVASG